MNSDKGGAPHTPKPQVDTALLVKCFLTRNNSLVKLGLHEFVQEPGLQPKGHCLGSALAKRACRLRATCEIHANDRDRLSALSPPPPPPCRRAFVKKRHRHQARKGATNNSPCEKGASSSNQDSSFVVEPQELGEPLIK